MSERKGTVRLEAWLPVVIVALDQVTKALVRRTLPLHESVTVVPGFLDFTHIRNTGAAFGFMDGADLPYKTVLLSAIAVASLVGVGFYAAGLPREQRLARWGLALILGGAAGNLIDRVTAGFVVDFVDVYWRAYHFWAFNVADSAITVGVTLWLLDALTTHHVSQAV
jgi:signal peptidase II